MIYDPENWPRWEAWKDENEDALLAVMAVLLIGVPLIALTIVFWLGLAFLK